MIYLIGGPARCGKTTLAAMLCRKLHAQSLSGDAMIRAIRDNTTVEQVPDIFSKLYDPIKHTDPPSKQIARLRRRDQIMWNYAASYLEAQQHNSNQDIIFEGGLWPDFLNNFKLDHAAIFLVDTSSDRAKRLIEMRNTNNANNWMQDWSDEKITKWAEFDTERSREIIRLCDENKYHYFDIAELSMGGAQIAARDYLLAQN